jgi:hypothetical protein
MFPYKLLKVLFGLSYVRAGSFIKLKFELFRRRKHSDNVRAVVNLAVCQ